MNLPVRQAGLNGGDTLLKDKLAGGLPNPNHIDTRRVTAHIYLFFIAAKQQTTKQVIDLYFCYCALHSKCSCGWVGVDSKTSFIFYVMYACERVISTIC